MYSYNFIEHTADIAVDLTASSIEELFVCAAEAWRTAIYDGEIKGNDEQEIILEADSLEELLVTFLSEINYFFLTKKWFCISIDDISIKQNDEYKLKVKLKGKNINGLSLDFNEEIKAVTYHQLKVEKKNDKYSTRIIFDI